MKCGKAVDRDKERTERDIKLLTHTFKIWQKVVDSGIRYHRISQKPVWIHARKTHHISDIHP